MSKETQKEKIERLERELLERDNKIEQLQEENRLLKSDNQDLNIKVGKQISDKLNLQNELEKVQARLETAEFWNNENNVGDLTIKTCRQGNRIKELEEELQKLKNENHTTKNARGAGRKSLLSDKKEEIKSLRAEGVKIKELAEKYNCSIGLIHKLINE